MPLTLLSWNVFNFSCDLTGNTPRVNRLLDVVNPVGGGPACTIFVIIEPTNKTTLQVGELAMGAGPFGMQALLAKLQVRTNGAGWKVAPPLSLAHGSKSETIAVFYDSAFVTLEGPEERRALPAPWNLATADNGRVFYVDSTNDNLRHGDLGATDTNLTNVVTGAQPSRIALDFPNNRLFFTDAGANSVRRANLIGGPNAALADVKTVANAGSITVDGARNHVFWYDTIAQAIKRADAGGTNAGVITAQGTVTAEPLGLIVDAFYGDVFFGDVPDRAIYQLAPGKNGYNLKTLVANVDLAAFVVDIESEWMYWADSVQRTIEGAMMNGTSRYTIVNNVDAVELAVDPGHSRIFWRDNVTNLIERASLHAGLNANVATVLNGAGNFRNLQLEPANDRVVWRDTGNVIRRASASGTDTNITAVVSANAGTTLAVDVGGVKLGKCAFDDRTGAAVKFPKKKQRNPYLVRFREIATGRHFYVLAAHSPSPHYSGNASQKTGARARNRDAQDGTTNLGTIADITVNRGADAVVVCGDFNCCSIPTPDLICKNPTGHDLDVNALDSMTTAGGADYEHFAQAMKILRLAAEATDAAESAAAEHASATGTLVAATAQTHANNAVAFANIAGAAATAAVAAVNAIPAGAVIRTGTLDALRGAATNAGIAASGLNAVLVTTLLATHQGDALQAKNDALTARNAILAMSDAFRANAADFLHALAHAVRKTVTVVDNPNAGGAPALANQVGQHAVDAGDAAEHVAAAHAEVATAQGRPVAGANAGNCLTRAKASRDAILAIEGTGAAAGQKIFTSHIYRTRTSLKVPATAGATRASHTNHAYDHILTVGCASVTSARLRNVIEELCVVWDLANVGLLMPLGTFQGIHANMYKGTGVSDHLPVEIVFTP